jgi:hypothetical protein
MQHSLSVRHLSRTSRNLISVFCCFLIIASSWLFVCFDNSHVASAEPLPDSLKGRVIATQPISMNNLKDKVKDDIGQKNHSDIGDSGPSNTIKSKDKSGKASSGQKFDDASQQMRRAGDQLDGLSDKDLAKIQGKDMNSETKVGDAIENVMDNIREKVN